ncbi:hypothetical protein EG346_15545 [Chryseobacterium carnipullorum]|uniref:Uncharacterized protein n=1 Tax=Chryseobacterium carnipullorum TaxID=1124835 RepID=A0A376DRZ8_CHRCU|nr:hypothetical protein [Chryseobacterium carnipullorum]AZA49503.1 hypothetical protein EG346_15545 [Chryseobacterium carnipullorum]AZA64401.1 hypothetical protein EG345_06540 [Chryseobacterium carnipullorum]STC94541.1 Uncharacterised protein [Chryseobacterium carnipullorum]
MKIINDDPDKNNLKSRALPDKIIIESGKKCTVSGEWETQGSISTIVYVSKGKLMPLYCGKKVKWILIMNG